MQHSLRRRLALRAGIAVIIAGLGAGSALAQDETVVATVNGQAITEADLKQAETDLGGQFAQLPEETRRAAVLSALIDMNLFSGEAVKEGLDKTPEFERQLAFLRQRALHSAFIEDTIASEITDDEIKARYDAEIAKIPEQQEVRAAH